MGDKSIDIVLFALIALFFGYQLWRVLGRRGDDEGRTNLPRPLDPPQPIPGNRPLGASPPGATGRPRIIDAVLKPLGAGPANPADPLAAGIAAIRAADPTFDPNEFLSGARQAFELIVMAFAEGNTATLRPLLTDDVYDSFAAVIRDRIAAGETVELRLARVDPPTLTEAHTVGNTAFVSVRFVSSQLAVTRDAAGKSVEGDLDHPVEHIDVWVFSRNTRSSNPNWMLVATGHPDGDTSDPAGPDNTADA